MQQEGNRNLKGSATQGEGGVGGVLFVQSKALPID